MVLFYVYDHVLTLEILLYQHLLYWICKLPYAYLAYVLSCIMLPHSHVLYNYHFAIAECGDNSMSLDQMNRLGLLQQDPPLPASHKLDVGLPSPSVSPSGSSTCYPSPTPSLPGAHSTPYVQLQGAILLRPRVDNMAHMNASNIYASHLPQATQSLPAQHSHRNIAPRKEPANPWRPW